MRLPLEIRARGLVLPEPLADEIRRRARKLDLFYGRIMGCRVTVEVPGRHHRRGRCTVRIDLTVPGKEIVITHQAGVGVAETVREAFSAAGRRIEDHVRKARGLVKGHAESQVGRVIRLFPERGYGFIESPDGLEIYFHRNSVTDLDFDRLEVGTRVRYGTEPGDKGPQATVVRPARRGAFGAGALIGGGGPNAFVLEERRKSFASRSQFHPSKRASERRRRMTTMCSRLKTFLDKKDLSYQGIPHAPDFTSQETAAHTRTRGKEFAKTVVLWSDGHYVMCVLPAHHRVDFEKVRQNLPAADVRLAREDEIGRMFPDCELGAEPPFGMLYGLPVLVSQAMADDEHVTFNAGTHADVLRMKFQDYRKLVEPRIMDFSVSPKG